MVDVVVDESVVISLLLVVEEVGTSPLLVVVLEGIGAGVNVVKPSIEVDLAVDEANSLFDVVEVS